MEECNEGGSHQMAVEKEEAPKSEVADDVMSSTS